MVPETFISVFYDVAKPRDYANAMYMHIDKKTFHNLTDGFPNKEVTLDGSLYTVYLTSTFHITNTVDNILFVICDVKKTN